MKNTLGFATAAALAASLLLTGAVTAQSASDSPAASMAPMTSPTPSTAPAASAATANAAVTISGFAFGPAAVTVTAGSMITWTNQDSAAHTVTADDGSFDSSSLAQGATFSQTFSTAGTVTYHCKIHPSMTGTITVG